MIIPYLHEITWHIIFRRYIAISRVLPSIKFNRWHRDSNQAPSCPNDPKVSAWSPLTILIRESTYQCYLVKRCSRIQSFCQPIDRNSLLNSQGSSKEGRIRESYCKVDRTIVSFCLSFGWGDCRNTYHYIWLRSFKKFEVQVEINLLCHFDTKCRNLPKRRSSFKSPRWRG